jgi:hypothetical protein
VLPGSSAMSFIPGLVLVWVERCSRLHLGPVALKFSLQHCILFAAIILPTITYASSWPQIRLIEASTVSTPLLGPSGSVCSVYDASVCADISKFFIPKKNRMARVSIMAALSPQLGLRFQLTEGTSAPKISIQEKLQFAVLLTRSKSNGSSFVYEFYSSIGGDLKHRPCVDSYDREYHCGTLTSWSEYQGKSVSFPEYGVRLKVIY